MIRTKKKCSIPDCTYPLFAHNYCLSHYRSLYLSKRQKSKIRYPIARRTKNRLKEESKYGSERKSFIDSEKGKNEHGKIFCIFCGKEIVGDPSLHHGNGRDGAKLLKKEDWFLSHNNCHVEEYHSKSWKNISWWYDYLDRIKLKNINIYFKELKRMEKTK